MNFCIAYAWRVAGRLYHASTVWAGDNARHALADFLRRNPHVCSARVVL